MTIRPLCALCIHTTHFQKLNYAHRLCAYTHTIYTLFYYYYYLFFIFLFFYLFKSRVRELKSQRVTFILGELQSSIREDSQSLPSLPTDLKMVVKKHEKKQHKNNWKRQYKG